jgi:hypothetical protein
MPRLVGDEPAQLLVEQCSEHAPRGGQRASALECPPSALTHRRLVVLRQLAQNAREGAGIRAFERRSGVT